MQKINVSIVLYHNNIDQLRRTINSVLNTSIDIKLFLIDNSAKDDLSILNQIDPRIEYIFNNRNIGYGSAHNIAIKQSIQDCIPYHLVLNPDVYFGDTVIQKLYDYMEIESNNNVGNILPQVRYPDYTIQYLCKLLPTPTDLVFRRFIPIEHLKDKINSRYELRNSGYNTIMDIPNLSGCFMFLRTSALKDVGIFDENIFMYLEDIDLNRRIHSKYKTIFYPEVEIYHDFAKESYVNKTLLKYHIKSAIYYFNKWGWLFDWERRKINNKVLKSIKS